LGAGTGGGGWPFRGRERHRRTFADALTMENI
jgi:hypothetical protein